MLPTNATNRLPLRSARNLLFVLMACVPAVALATQPQSIPNPEANSATTTMTPEKLWDLGRVGEAAISPDGKWLTYTVTRYQLAENSGSADLLLAPVDGPDAIEGLATGLGTEMSTASKPRTLLTAIPGLQAIQWVDRPEGLRLLYLAPGKLKATDPQAWSINPATGESRQLTDIEGGIGNLRSTPNGSRLAFTRDIPLDDSLAKLHPDLPKADARIIDSLMYRLWNAWHDGAYSHVHVAPWNADGSMGPPIDLMEGMKADCPLPPLAGSEHLQWSPDGRQIALVIKPVERPAESTDSSVFTSDLADQLGPQGQLVASPLVNQTPDNPGYDVDPTYSPDGKWLAWIAMERPGFEADRARIMARRRSDGNTTEWTSGFDASAHNLLWSPSGERLVFDSEQRGAQQIFSIDVASGNLEQQTQGPHDLHTVQVLPDGRILATQQSMVRPVELALINPADGKIETVTDVNGETFRKLSLPTVQERYVPATDGQKIHNWLILPPGFDPKKKYPMLVFCQGGPQSQVGQFFSSRWNFHLMAAKGYVVLAVNRRGLPGFGQAWNDQISGDWGGQAMRDILSSTDALRSEPFIDAKRVGAVGASFGGYTVYWLMGNSGDRFSAMISHCGVFDLESMYGTTEELFFVNHDLGGPYWSSESVQKKYDQFSPHQFIGNWKTPLLVIHGEKDFRVPVSQGMEAFTAAQVQGIPSRFLYFPGEGHWVTKPQNSVLWQRVFFDWLDQHLSE
ncbi:MAG: S9 family peptidase [Pirellulaceae bacterium]